MSLLTWITGFSTQHALACGGQLSPSEHHAYLEQRNELARMMLGAQALMDQPGQFPRRALRVARAFAVDIAWPSGSVGTTTLDVSSGGFSALHKVQPPALERVPFTMRLPREGVVSGIAEIVGSRAHAGIFRVSFHIAEMTDTDRERLELNVFDAVLDIVQS